MSNEAGKMVRIDNMAEIRDRLEDLIGTMAVIYEGLCAGEMEDESPHCIQVLQHDAEQILSMVNRELKGQPEKPRD